MKFNATLFIAALGAMSLFTACQNGTEASGTAADTEGAGTSTTVAPPTDLPADAMTGAPNIAPVSTTPPATTEPAQNEKGVWHYTCAKGCAGGAGTATACAKCGTTLAHNQAYHGPATTAPGTPGQTVQVPSPGQPEPAQNAAGVWHYTCPDGCAGGAGSSIACAKCSKQLAHNAAYHGN